MGISAVINMTEKSYHTRLRVSFEEAAESLLYEHLPLPDLPGEDIKKYFVPSHMFIDRAKAEGRKVLVHCGEGVSRAATVVVSYLMAKEGMRLKQALIFLFEKRPIVKPNNGFLAQLAQFEKERLGECSVPKKLWEDKWGWGSREIIMTHLREKAQWNKEKGPSKGDTL